ncbi:hypothetical protein [Bradyrhizobium sp. AUGA SZCCT0283]|uniref:hypothetical protein n=1 Tax=Bradyrhizobium sp. AUGA SZCCT0283 TaxID=2807671 RepID=UPI001BA99B99|nr:hypothetical protein [Bradyrhizobium sp. AUGA SZCCT0283]MBR1280356.1 hypothetical protein [Bradyrhizobium sp. AUGA SZCCT0283]
MSAQIVLLPVFILVILSLVVLLWSARTRATVEAGSGPVGSLDLQFLFYILIALTLPLRHADLIIVLLSWVFVVTSFASAGLVSTIDSKQRTLAWRAGAMVLLAMWIYFALRILLLI